MFHLAAAIVIGLLAWQGLNHLHARYGLQGIVRWCVLSVRAVLLALLVLIVLVVDLALLFSEASKPHSDWLFTLINAHIFVVLIIFERKRRQQLQDHPQDHPHEAVAMLTAQGMPKAIAEMMAKDLTHWCAEFMRKHRREPSKEEGCAWGSQWMKKHGAEMKKHSAEIMRKSLEAIGLPKPSAATDAFTDWIDAFMRKHGREPSDAEFNNWIACWRELHGVTIRASS